MRKGWRGYVDVFREDPRGWAIYAGTIVGICFVGSVVIGLLIR